jgi:hypothetical protein
MALRIVQEARQRQAGLLCTSCLRGNRDSTQWLKNLSAFNLFSPNYSVIQSALQTVVE